MRSLQVALVLLCLMLPSYSQRRLVLEREYPAERESSYQYLPFHVPPGTQEVKVRYSYSDRRGKGRWLSEADRASAVDIGLFDQRGRAEGFRGWSGGKRSQFFVGSHQATPGYLSGPMESGEWSLILGLYKVAPDGVRVRVEIDFLEQSQPAVERAKSTLASSGGPGWYSGALHVHSVHSDGDRTITELFKEVSDAGLDFVALTEHNTYSHHNAVPDTDLLVLLGEEVTTLVGHFNLWGVPAGHWGDFRRPFSEVSQECHDVGGLVAINHPFGDCKGCDWQHGFDCENYDVIEVWNGPWDEADEQALELWNEMLRAGRRVSAVAASDSHNPKDPVDHPCTHVKVSALEQGSVLEGLKNGHSYMSGSAQGPEIRFFCGTTGIGETVPRQGERLRFQVEASVNATVDFVYPEGRTSRHLSKAQPRCEFSVRGDRSGFVRVELRDASGKVLALTNPIYY